MMERELTFSRACHILNCDNDCKMLGTVYHRMIFGTFMVICVGNRRLCCRQRGKHFVLMWLFFYLENALQPVFYLKVYHGVITNLLIWIIVVVYCKLSGGSWSYLRCGYVASGPPGVWRWDAEMMVDPWRKWCILWGGGMPSVCGFLGSCRVVMMLGSFCADSFEIGHGLLGTV